MSPIPFDPSKARPKPQPPAEPAVDPLEAIVGEMPGFVSCDFCDDPAIWECKCSNPDCVNTMWWCHASAVRYLAAFYAIEHGAGESIGVQCAKCGSDMIPPVLV